MSEPITRSELTRAIEALGKTRPPEDLNGAERDAYCYALGVGAGLLWSVVRGIE